MSTASIPGQIIYETEQEQGKSDDELSVNADQNHKKLIMADKDDHQVVIGGKTLHWS